ncbi:MAG: gluconate 2-dehydrogenase subunit 3 family protein, partial [Calditrichaeota bacterium]
TSRFKLTASQRQRLENVQDILFPSEPDAPGARDINAAEYLQAVLLDPRMDPEEMDFIINGLNWLEEEALERWEKSYNNMLPLEKEMLIEHVSGLDWGSSWLSTLLLFIFEALLSDPLYGGNPDGIGWKWLGYTPGQPRPKKKYDAYL